ncbi:MAG: NAD-dependent epimerase/dehydratase family protein [Allosphingosinicella sp.]
MKLLVTGAAGMVGGHVARLAAAAGHEVHAISRRPIPAGAAAGVTGHVADLLDSHAADALVRRIAPTHLVHAAWETTQPTYWHSLANLDWVRATVTLARAFAEAGGGRFVQIGSCAEYDWSHGTCIEDETPERPATRYGLAKLAAFRAVEAAALDRFAAINARIFFVYGPGENRDRLIPYVCCSHAAGQVPQLSSGRQVRDLLYVDDAAAAILAVAGSEATGTVNIGSGVPVQLADAATILARLAGDRETGLGRRPDRAGDPDRLVPETRRLFALGWRPSVSLEDGLARTYAWWSKG